ncbi:MAG: tripartite tricarboxylate transporter substrate binding protein, partial [Acetobacteraceae bacterium]|nr:tripartite tricarboxylate transporter substrate binding protein [Acetobacteraceae bacterium]
MKRRSLIAASVGGLASPAAWAQTGWPDRPIRLVVPFAAGTSTDIIGRLVAAQLSRGLGGVPVPVDNRAGAGGSIAALHVAQQPPDGATLLLSTIGTHAVNPHLMRGLQYDPARDFTPVVAHSRTRILLVARPQLGPRTMGEFLDLARARSVSVASPGTGTTGHLGHALLTMATGIEMLHAPYRDGGRAVTDLLSGRIDSMFYHTQFVRPHIEAGAMLGLGITGAGRSEALPDVPSMAEAGLPQVDVVGWWALHGPAGLPAPIVARVNGVLNAAIREPDTLAAFARNGVEPMGGTPA